MLILQSIKISPFSPQVHTPTLQKLDDVGSEVQLAKNFITLKGCKIARLDIKVKSLVVEER